MDYPFSTLHGLLGKSAIYIPVEEDTILFEDSSPERVLKWLDTAPEPQNYETLRKALKRKILKFPKNKWGNSRHTLEMHLL
jgi:hypothetical protein